MTKAQALALINALEARQINCDCLLRFDQTGAEQWSVQLDTTHTYTGAQLDALATYCAQNALQLTAIFEQLGIV